MVVVRPLVREGDPLEGGRGGSVKDRPVTGLPQGVTARCDRKV